MSSFANSYEFATYEPVLELQCLCCPALPPGCTTTSQASGITRQQLHVISSNHFHRPISETGAASPAAMLGASPRTH